MLAVYGIKQCDTCRKALKWLDAKGITHEFHDLRIDGLDAPTLQAWLDSPFTEVLVNRRSTTWRSLDPARRETADRVALLLEHPTLVKRPVFVVGGQVVAVGFGAAEQESLLKAVGQGLKS